MMAFNPLDSTNYSRLTKSRLRVLSREYFVWLPIFVESNYHKVWLTFNLDMEDITGYRFWPTFNPNYSLIGSPHRSEYRSHCTRTIGSNTLEYLRFISVSIYPLKIFVRVIRWKINRFWARGVEPFSPTSKVRNMFFNGETFCGDRIEGLWVETFSR